MWRGGASGRDADHRGAISGRPLTDKTPQGKTWRGRPGRRRYKLLRTKPGIVVVSRGLTCGGSADGSGGLSSRRTLDRKGAGTIKPPGGMPWQTVVMNRGSI